MGHDFRIFEQSLHYKNLNSLCDYHLVLKIYIFPSFYRCLFSSVQFGSFYDCGFILTYSVIVVSAVFERWCIVKNTSFKLGRNKQNSPKQSWFLVFPLFQHGVVEQFPANIEQYFCLKRPSLEYAVLFNVNYSQKYAQTGFQHLWF